MSVVLDSRLHAGAIKAAIDAELGPIPGTTDTRVYDYDEVPGANGNTGEQPRIYVAISLERRFNPNLRASGRAGSTGWRLAARANGNTVDEVRWALLKVAEALDEVRLTISGSRTTPIQFEAEIEAPKFDDGKFTAANSYIYAIH